VRVGENTVKEETKILAALQALAKMACQQNCSIPLIKGLARF
jgi:hypothetical protein